MNMSYKKCKKRGQRCETWSLTYVLDYWTGLLDSFCCQAANRHQVSKKQTKVENLASCM